MPVIAFSTDTATVLEENYRLPPTFIGARRVRPSSKAVRDIIKQKKIKNGKADNKSESVPRTNLDDSQHTCAKEVREVGVSPPSTKPNNDHDDFQNEASSLLKNANTTSSNNNLPCNSNQAKKQKRADKTTNIHAANQELSINHRSSMKEDVTPYADVQNEIYFQFEVNIKSSVQKEIAEILGETRTVPIILSDPMSDQIPYALKESRHQNDDSEKHIILDKELSHQWAIAVSESMKSAENQRDSEDMRLMAYRLIPEVWSRFISGMPTRETVERVSLDQEERTTKLITHPIDYSMFKQDTIHTPMRSESTTPLPSDPTAINYDTSLKIVYEYLFRQYPTMHLACGAKFGCDFLLYDDCRKKRHAFAGLRVLEASHHQCIYMHKCNGKEVQFSIPTPYDLAAYVRTLNKAGKLAILGMVIRESKPRKSHHQSHVAANRPEVSTDSDKSDDMYRVLFIDLALEKILSAPTHQRKYKKPSQKRKEIGQNLSKE